MPKIAAEYSYTQLDDSATVIWETGPYIKDKVSHGVELLRDQDTCRVIGVRLTGIIQIGNLSQSQLIEKLRNANDTIYHLENELEELKDRYDEEDDS